MAQCSPQNVQESIINGDFESGYIGSGAGSFTSSQVYLYDASNSAMSTLVDAIKSNPTNPANGCAWTSAGHFEVDSYFGPFQCSGGSYDGHPFIAEGAGRYDHTKGVGQNGKYLMIDGQNGTSADPLGWKLWEQNLNVYGNQLYYFSAWFINLTPISTGADRADLRFVVQPYDASNNPIGGAVQLGATTWSPAETSRGNNWEQYYETYTTPVTAVTVKLSIYNQTSVVNGNDIGVDDISFINGCSNILSLSTPPSPSLGAAKNLCESNGTITLNSSVATNAGAGRTFSWYNGTGTTQTQIGSTNTTSTTLAITTPGTYRVCVYQPGGCAKSSSVVVSSSASAGGSDINYCSTSNLTASITTAAVEPFLTYSWKKNGSAWSGSANSKSVTVDGTGTYLLTGTHSNGIAACNVSKTFTVSASTASFASNIGPGPYTLCNPSSQLLTSSLTDVTYTYQWYKNGTAIPYQIFSSYNVNTAGTFKVEVAINKVGCAKVMSNSVTVTTSNAITPADATFCPNASVTLSVTPTLSNVYRWYDSDNSTVVLAPGATSSSYTTPVLTASKTYYVEDTRVSSTTLSTTVGAANGYGANSITTFSLTNPIILKSVQVQRSGQWQGNLSINVEVYNSSGTLLGTSSLATESDGTTPTAIKTVTFTPNISLPIGSNYYMQIKAGSSWGGLNSWANPSGSGASVVSVSTGNNIFGNWGIDVPTNTCGRVPVTATGNCILPLTFADVIGKRIDDENRIIWNTLDEKNVSLFEVQKSYDGIIFTTIGMVSATNGKGMNEYEFLDPNSSEDQIAYYRLKEVDVDGIFNYSTVISIRVNDTNTVSIAPSSFDHETTVSIISSEDEINHLKVYDAKGVLIVDRTLTGSEKLNLGQNWEQGFYILTVFNDRKSTTLKLVKR